MSEHPEMTDDQRRSLGELLEEEFSQIYGDRWQGIAEFAWRWCWLQWAPAQLVGRSNEQMVNKFVAITQGLVDNNQRLTELLKAQQEKIDGMEADNARRIVAMAGSPSRVPTDAEIQQWQRELRGDTGPMPSQDGERAEPVPDEHGTQCPDQR